MILSDKEIWMEIQSGTLKFDPSIEPEQVSPSAIDLRLASEFTVLKEPPSGSTTYIDFLKSDNVEELVKFHGDVKTVKKGDIFLLEPHKLVLAYTEEYVELPNHIAARIEGRSSLARFGISVHSTAPTVHATFRGQLRLEIYNCGPLTCALRPGFKVCQLILERLGTPSSGSLVSAWQGQRQD